MPVYVVALIRIDDRARYGEYESGFMDIFERYQGRILAVDDDGRALEGDWNHTRTVLLEFPNDTALQAWYDSDDYQALMQHRLAASSANIGVIQGRQGS
ncbi:MAG: DUF1330 domain-containing protein [Pseudomonadales bacterium]